MQEDNTPHTPLVQVAVLQEHVISPIRMERAMVAFIAILMPFYVSAVAIVVF